MRKFWVSLVPLLILALVMGTVACHVGICVGSWVIYALTPPPLLPLVLFQTVSDTQFCEASVVSSVPPTTV